MTPAKWFELSGRTALVTGSSRGIGAAIARGLAAAGAEVIVHGSAPTPQAEAVAADIKAAGGRAELRFADLADAAACRELAVNPGRAIDILVLNASFEQRQDPVADLGPEFDRQINVNLRASLLLLQALLPGMTARGWGRLLFLGSIQEVKPNPRMLVYAASKAAQTNLARNLARTIAGGGVTANVLAPGAILTDRNAEVLADAGYRSRIESAIPAGRIGKAEDCVGAALLLCSDAGSYINGAVLPVDGGWAVS